MDQGKRQILKWGIIAVLVILFLVIIYAIFSKTEEVVPGTPGTPGTTVTHQGLGSLALEWCTKTGLC